MLENEPNVVPVWIVSWIATAAGSLIAALATAMWRRHNADIVELKVRHNSDIADLKARIDEAVTLEMYEQNRREMREDINRLYLKIDGIDMRAQSRHDAVMERLSGR